VAIIEFNPDFRRVAFALERIADALDRAIPVRQERVKPKPAVFIQVDPEAIAEAEEEAERRAAAGTGGQE
jgi:hypothetical protein